jgi:hypothetical protein
VDERRHDPLLVESHHRSFMADRAGAGRQGRRPDGNAFDQGIDRPDDDERQHGRGDHAADHRQPGDFY